MMSASTGVWSGFESRKGRTHRAIKAELDARAALASPLVVALAAEVTPLASKWLATVAEAARATDALPLTRASAAVLLHQADVGAAASLNEDEAVLVDLVAVGVGGRSRHDGVWQQSFAVSHALRSRLCEDTIIAEHHRSIARP